MHYSHALAYFIVTPHESKKSVLWVKIYWCDNKNGLSISINLPDDNLGV